MALLRLSVGKGIHRLLKDHQIFLSARLCTGLLLPHYFFLFFPQNPFLSQSSLFPETPTILAHIPPLAFQ